MCNSNQRAQKSLSICRVPDILMVYLKRFVFHELQSIKVDDPVTFPLTDFDLSPFVQDASDDGSGQCYKYDLHGCVCHYGGQSVEIACCS